MTPRPLAAALAVLVTSGAVLTACGSDDPETVSGSTSTEVTTTEPASSGSSSTTSSTAGTSSTGSTGGSTSTNPAADTSVAVFPNPSGSLRFDDAVDAATAFATDYVGFVSPEVGDFASTGPGAGSVPVQPMADGPVTTVVVQEIGGDWWVLGSTTANIVVAEPAALATVTSPAALAGTSTAFEANVEVRVRADGSTMPIGQGFVMGGSMGDMGPFSGSVEFDDPSTAAGAVLFTTSSMESGDVWEATVVRVRFG